MEEHDEAYVKETPSSRDAGVAHVASPAITASPANTASPATAASAAPEAPPVALGARPSQTDPEAARFVAAVMAYAAVTPRRPGSRRVEREAGNVFQEMRAGVEEHIMSVVVAEKDGWRRERRAASPSRRRSPSRSRSSPRSRSARCRGNKACRRRLRRGDDEPAAAAPEAILGRGQPESPRAHAPYRPRRLRRDGRRGAHRCGRGRRRRRVRAPSQEGEASRGERRGARDERGGVRRTPPRSVREGAGRGAARRVWVRPPRVGAQSDVRARRDGAPCGGGGGTGRGGGAARDRRDRRQAAVQKSRGVRVVVGGGARPRGAYGRSSRLVADAVLDVGTSAVSPRRTRARSSFVAGRGARGVRPGLGL